MKVDSTNFPTFLEQELVEEQVPVGELEPVVGQGPVGEMELELVEDLGLATEREMGWGSEMGLDLG